MKSFMHWLATAATLSFSVPMQASHNDPRLPQLFEHLEAATSAEEAEPIELSIWQIWLQSGNGEVDAHMLRGLQAMNMCNHEAAITAYGKAIRKQPEFAEAWNKRATANYLLGRLDLSINDIGKTLELEPRHFGSLSGLGLINLTLAREREALKAFEAAIRIHPHLPGAETHIRELRAKVKGKGI
ncbi:MAG: tetratricopeptide repeat protein [Pseudomonadota bacterium]|nr:tetratricopeptide repeat protein [Pseudomonadota bacterium]